MDLYAQNILDHNKHPHNYGELKDANACAKDVNPLCGDKLSIQLKIDKKGIIKDAKFTGAGCAISRAGASMLMDNIIGKSADEVERYTTEEVYKIMGIQITPARIKCALLALTIVKKAVQSSSSGKKSSRTGNNPKK